ncbi:MAG: hypothetical protein AAFX87_00190 [Bacteroidota bacterium]
MKTKSLFKASLIGTLVMFLWGATEWFNPLLHQPYKKVSNPHLVNETLNANMPESGMYVWPHGDESKRNGEAQEIVYFVAKSDPSFYNPAKFMGVELLTQLLVWILITYLLLRTGFAKHWTRVKFIMGIGVLVGLTFFLPLWNWWAFSTEYVLARWLNMLAGWFLAGSAVSYFLRNKFSTSN